MNNLGTIGGIVKMVESCEEKIDSLVKYINTLDINSKITIQSFKNAIGLTNDKSVKIILDELCKAKILRKMNRIYRCPTCGMLLDKLFEWDEGKPKYCFSCDTLHQKTSKDNTETVYMKYYEKAPKTMKIYYGEWFEKVNEEYLDINTASCYIMAYTSLDAKNAIIEQYNPVPDSISIIEIEIENKKILK